MNPPPNKSIKTLDAFHRNLFKTQVSISCLSIPAVLCKEAQQLFHNRGILLNVPKLSCITAHPSDKNRRLLLLDPLLKPQGFPSNLLEFIKQNNAQVQSHSLELDYDFWNADQILRSILPDDLQVPNSFDTVGHIAHFNLRPEYEPFKHIIGQVILDKAKNIKTVVNKTGNINTKFRFFEMEVLAGQESLATELVKDVNFCMKENANSSSTFPKLQAEHDRIIKFFKKGDIICDVFGGIGPFALPAAKQKECHVFCNDLNPDSYKYLVENIKLNNLSEYVAPFNMDGRDFIRKSLDLVNTSTYWKSFHDEKSRKIQSNNKRKGKNEPVPKFEFKPVFPKHYVMNLPASAPEFLDAFSGIFRGKEDAEMPIIHCHLFSKAADREKDAVEMCEKYLGARIEPIHVQNVRNVAPNKDMMCVSFKLPIQIAFKSAKRKASIG